MVIDYQIDDALYLYDTKRGTLKIARGKATPIELDAALVHGLLWFLRMANVGQHAGRIERQRWQEQNDYEPR